MTVGNLCRAGVETQNLVVRALRKIAPNNSLKERCIPIKPIKFQAFISGAEIPALGVDTGIASGYPPLRESLCEEL